ncbi:chloride channel protein [Streptomyces sp. RKND-216]|uniref:chloride channel protein n=1 Tax=Streptomyces sp. RKND-216 TaxID=2562581 RepID=UPI00109E1BB2|nr:chloride channel protein [Streptomyces sp. RKND-216]THA24940.1 chloride channel protein [Streptomyces sp. RKND-216]
MAAGSGTPSPSPGPRPGSGAATGAVGDPLALVRSRRYAVLLVASALLGVPVCAAAFGFLALTESLQHVLWKDLPEALGLAATPLWWPLPLLAVGGLCAGLAIRYLPGNGGHEPSAGFAPGAPPRAVELPGIVLAALASLSFGAVLGPEAPLLALGAGLAANAVRLARRDPAPQASTVLGAAGSFAAVSSLLGSPLLGAFLLMEASGLAGAMLGPVLVPGLLAAGVGSLLFVGLGSWTGLGTYALELTDVPPAQDPTVPEFGYAVLTGLVAALACALVRRGAVRVRRWVEPRRVTGTVCLGLAVGAVAVGYAAGTDREASEVLYSGQSALSPLLADAAGYSAATLALLLVCKTVMYALCLAGFRGGPVFPAMFVGATGGLLLAHLPGLSPLSGFAIGIGAMGTAMLRLPLTSVLLATLLLGKAGLTVMPLVIVAVVTAYVGTAVLSPPGTAGDTADR